MRERRFCAILFRTARKSLILNGEISEWLKEHAWKAYRGAAERPQKYALCGAHPAAEPGPARSPASRRRQTLVCLPRELRVVGLVRPVAAAAQCRDALEDSGSRARRVAFKRGWAKTFAPLRMASSICATRASVGCS
jgi:hypothetical protein